MKKIIFASIVAVAMLVVSCGQNAGETKCAKEGECCEAKACCVENPDDCQLVIHVPFKIKPEHVAGFIKAINKCAAATKQEPGCLDYSIYQSPNDSTLFFLNEGWANKAAHLAHMETEHIKVYFEEIKGMQDKDETRKFEEFRICPKLNEKK
ncbi:hypothetical protein MASR1M31_13860 [Porphyromonadaceae bacterium]